MNDHNDKENAIKEIQNWLKEENIHNARYDRPMIVKFLAGCKYQIDKVKMKMKNFYKIRRTSPELFKGRDPLQKNLEALLDLGAFFPLPRKDDRGHTLIVVKGTAHDPKSIPMADVFKIGVMSVDLLLELDDDIATPGVVVIVDLTGVTLHHAIQMTPGLIWKMVHLWQACYPIRIYGMHFINCPSGIDVVLNIFKRFLTENLKQRIQTHGKEWNSLHAFVANDLLPTEYGGELGPVDIIISEWKRKVLTHRGWFLHDDTLI